MFSGKKQWFPDFPQHNLVNHFLPKTDAYCYRYIAEAYRVYIYILFAYIYIPADAKPRERFEGLLNRTVRITCNFQYKMLFRTLLITHFWWKKVASKSIEFWQILANTMCIRRGFDEFFNTHRRLSDPSVWKLSSTASCHYGTHNAIASNAGTAERNMQSVLEVKWKQCRA